MAARPPYNIILAGKYGVGKTALFRYLSENTAQSVRKWDKDEHVVSLETGDVKVGHTSTEYLIVYGDY